MLLTLLFSQSCKIAELIDDQAPEVYIVKPIDGSTIADTIKIRATVADNSDYVSLDFLIDGELIETVDHEPYETLYDTKNSTNGNHLIQCRATDKAGNSSLSDIVNVFVSNPIPIFSANILESYLHETETGFIFISDLMDNVLFEHEWEGSTNINFSLPATYETIPNTVTITITRSDEYDASVITYFAVPIGASWMLANHRSSNIFQANVNFDNIPLHDDGYAYSTKNNRFRTHSSSQLQSPLKVQLEEDRTNLLIALFNQNTPNYYVWKEEFNSGENFIDSASFFPAHQQDFIVNKPCYVFSLFLYGLLGKNRESLYICDRKTMALKELSTIGINYPFGIFDNYLTNVFLTTENFGGDPNWGWLKYSFGTYGEIPQVFSTLVSEISVKREIPGCIEYEYFGSGINSISSWEPKDYNGYYVSWTAIGPIDLKQHSLPRPPKAWRRNFDYDKGDFIPDGIYFRDYLGFVTYEEFLTFFYSQDKPSSLSYSKYQSFGLSKNWYEPNSVDILLIN